MSGHNEFSGFPNDFTGIARVFPVPNRVLFPHVLQPLRIFEPRYCTLLEDALRDDQMIAMSYARPGWQAKQADWPDSNVVCLGRVVSHARDSRGEHNVMLLGMSRAVIKKELSTELPYRIARVSLLGDVYPQTGSGNRVDLQNRLLDCFAPFVAESRTAREQFHEMAQCRVPLGILTDVLSYMIDIDLTIKQALLTERDVDLRASILVDCLEDMLRTSESSYADRPFPPKFSRN